MAKNILVIDDEELVTESLKRLLKKEGYNVAIAKDAEEAMQKVSETDFSLIVSDIMIPIMDGIDIVENIRQYLKQSGKKPVPEVLITGYSNEDNIRRAQELKVADFICKPFDIKDFLEIIKKNLK